MNKNKIELLLSDKLKEINFLEDSNILFGKQKYKDLTLGTYFIDYGDNNFEFDLNDYQEKYISSEYYNNSGNEQWNFYLIFIRESYSELDKHRIEKDSIYTRKFVFTPDELVDYFDYQKSEKAVDADVINLWKEKLKEVDLDEVYSNAPYAQAVPRYLTKEVIKDEESNQVSSNINTDLSIKKISRLKLNPNYRKYPIKRDFSLGKVNLIKGVNGTGKTSFLEAIELSIAGKNYSNPTSVEENGSINAEYNDDNAFIDDYTPNNNAKYRQRDIAWYSSAYKSGNELYRAFNKYNFYDSDAAYNLSHDSDINSLSKYLSSIALGPEFNRIQDRLFGFKERLLKENNNRKKELGEAKNNIKEASKIIDSVKLKSNPDDKFKTFLEYSKEINWTKKLPKNYDENYNDFIEDHHTSQSHINSLNQFLPTIKLRTKKSWEEELEKLQKALFACNKIKSEIEIDKKGIESNKVLLNKKNISFQILKSAKKYFDEKSSFELLKLSDQISKVSIEIKRDSRALEIIESISDLDAFDSNTNFANLKSVQIRKQTNLLEKQKKLKLKIKNLKVNLNKLQSIISEIKSYGKQYITLNNKAEECPLCDTKFEHEVLEERISKIEKNIKENVSIDEFNKELIDVEKELLIINILIKNTHLIEKAISIIHSDDSYSELKLNEIKSQFKLVKNRNSKNIESNSGFKMLKQELEDKGFYEVEFKEIKEEFENYFSEMKFSFSEKTMFEKQYLALKKELSDISNSTSKIKEKLLLNEKAQNKIIEEVAPSFNLIEYEKDFNYRIELLKTGIVNFNSLKDFFAYSEEEDISNLSQKLDKLHILYEDIKKSIRDQKELVLANKLINDSKSRIKILEPDCNRLDSGLEVIFDILSNHNESTILGDFIKDNEIEIQEIFQNIHSPNEFSKIIFSDSENSIYLKRRIEDVEVPINKISTGQRSALALSIFLALNKKLKNGPNLILFDDPVTYTDDLNILSFLDYLREIVINENRQVVFATASQKLAGLFETKFAFLGETEYKTFEFER